MKHFFIDSENVGDFWIPLLNLPAEEAELTVFYTKNSPHMSYDSLIRLKESDRKVTFVKCYEGTNALDFQLCSELGFRLCAAQDDEFIIVTNDTGFDAAVKYWRHRKFHVRRITGKDAKAVEKQTPPTKRKPENEYTLSGKVPAEVKTIPEIETAALLEEAVTEAIESIVAEAAGTQEQAASVDTTEEMAEETPADDYAEPEEPAETTEDALTAETFTEEPDEEEPETEETEAEETQELIVSEPAPEEKADKADQPYDEEELTVIVSCIGLDNLAELHNQLIQFYGENGKNIYQSIKNGSLQIVPQEWDKSEKFLYYCALIIRHSDLEEEYRKEESISALAEFLCGAESKRRNLNSLRYALLKKFGKDLGRRYYFLLKPYVKAMNQM